MRYFIALLSLLTLVNAQFGGFFDQMFGQQGGHGHEQRQQQQNNPSDAAHYRNQYEHCKDLRYLESIGGDLTLSSFLRQVPLPRYPRLRPLPSPLPLRLGRSARKV